MNYRLSILPEAENDLAEARFWYEKQRDGLGAEFLDCVGEVFQRLQESPLIHAEVHRGVRRTLVRRFPFVVYYRVEHDVVEILAVLHGRRGPRIWRSRI